MSDEYKEFHETILNIYNILDEMSRRIIGIETLIAKFFTAGEKGPEALIKKQKNFVDGLNVITKDAITEDNIKLNVTEEVIHKQKSKQKYNIAAKACKTCGGLISWDDYDHKNKSGRPVHVDGDGYKIGKGGCPAWVPDWEGHK